MSGESWKAFSTGEAIDHPVRDLIHQDPMTRRSFDKPRGYAGDAVLLDYIYRIRQPDEQSPFASVVYDYACGRAAASAVRHRRALLAHSIERAADRTDAGAHILSVACGHLREAELSAAVRRGWVDRFVALDGDPHSLKEIASSWDGPVECVHMQVARLLGRASQLGRFDLIYSAGLYDYLDDNLAMRLTGSLFDTLRPGGTLLLSNFLPTVPDAGYMESYMGWQLLYRTPDELAAVAEGIPRGNVARARTFRDPFDAIVYLEVVRS